MKYLLILILSINVCFADTEIKDVLIDVSQKYSVSYKLLSKIADIESRFDVLAKSKTSSARGMFQIINTTEIWLRELCYIEGDIYDIKVNSEMAACYINHNKKYLKRKLNRDINMLDLYLAHFLGAYRAYKFLQLSNKDYAYKIFKNESRANRSIFFHKNGKPKTVREIKNEFIEKLNKARVL